MDTPIYIRMKIAQSLILGVLAISLTVGCSGSGDKSKSGETENESGGLFSSGSKNEAQEIIDFNNKMVQTENNHNSFIRNYIRSVDNLDNFIKKKIANPDAIAIAPILIRPIMVNQSKDLKAPSSLKGNYAAWIDSLQTSFASLQNLYKEMENYKSAEDWKEDQGKKMNEFKEKGMAEIQKNENASKALFNALRPEADKAEAEILKDHPFKDQIISSKKVMEYCKEITMGTYDDVSNQTFKANFDKQYIELESLLKKNKENPIKGDQYESNNRRFNTFNDAVETYLGKMRIIQREMNAGSEISEGAFTDLDNAAQTVVSTYNNFVN